MDEQEKRYMQLLDRAFEKIGEPQVATNVDFKIPEVDSIIQGTKTIIRNFSQIADIARRKPEQIERFLIKELGTPANIQGQSLIISAKFQANVLNDKIKKYFNTYVICKECHKPDTHIEYSERGYTVLVCEACGARYTVKEP